MKANNVTFCELAYRMVGVLKDQASYYLTSYSAISAGIDERGEEISAALTLRTNVSLSAPLEGQFKSTAPVAAFLDGTLFTIIIFLGILSAMLLYSLMLSDVDSKTYDYAMLRALGFRKRMLVVMIIEQSLGFSVPGLAFGILVAWQLNLALRQVVFIAAQNYMTYSMATSAVAIGVAFGLMMPMVANYLPIRAAMGKNLRTSLDLSRRSGGEITAKVQRLQDVGMDPVQFGVALILVTVGFVTYYLVPYAFVEGQLSLVFTLLNLLLVMIIIGLTLICVLVFPMLEQLLLWLTLNTCCRRDRRFAAVVEKNMEGHRKRNSKTSILFTLAIAFLIFSASSFHLIATLIEKTALSLLGADLYGIAVNGYMTEIPIAAFLDEQKERGLVADYAFVCTA